MVQYTSIFQKNISRVRPTIISTIFQFSWKPHTHFRIEISREENEENVIRNHEKILFFPSGVDMDRQTDTDIHRALLICIDV